MPPPETVLVALQEKVMFHVFNEAEAAGGVVHRRRAEGGWMGRGWGVKDLLNNVKKKLQNWLSGASRND